MVRKVPFPESVAALELLEDVSYRDAYAAPLTGDHTAEEWIRLALGAAPAWLLAGIRIAQTRLGLRLSSPSDDRPLGWRILRSDPDILILGAEGPHGAARLAGVVGDGQLIFTTQASFGRRTRLLWAVVQWPHRGIARYLMSRALRAGRSGQPAISSA
jgi:hypothetical protein